MSKRTRPDDAHSSMAGTSMTGSGAAATWLSHSGGTLATLLAKARVLDTLTARVRPHLPVPLRNHCRVVNIEDRLLVLAADSSAWAMKLRFQAPTLIEALRGSKDLAALQTVRVIVTPLTPNPTTTVLESERRAAPAVLAELRALLSRTER